MAADSPAPILGEKRSEIEEKQYKEHDNKNILKEFFL